MIGLSYSDFLKMDIRQFENYVDGFTDRREVSLNDTQSFLKPLAGYISMAVWGSNKFSMPVKPIRLRGESRAAKIAAALNQLGVKKDGLIDYMQRKEKKRNGRQSAE